MNRPVKAVVLPPGPRLLAALTAALEGTGPAICPLSPDLNDAELDRGLAAVRPAEVETPAGVRRLDGAVPAAESTAVLVATSGSTGAPKVAALAATALRASARATLERIGARAGQRWLCCLPPAHIAGVQVLVRSVVAGTDPVILERFDPAAFAQAVRAHRVDHVALVPTQLRRLLAASVELASLKTILLGGAAADPGLLAAARTAGARIVTTYGMSETSGGCVYDGVPLDGVEVRVGSGGLVHIAGPVLFEEYRLRPDLTARARDGRWFVTRDLGRLTGDGRLRILGRIDDVINTGGQKVAAGEVAAVLSRHPRISEAAVVGRPDPEWGERVTAVIVPAPGQAAPPGLAELRTWVRASMPAYAAPRELDVVPAIPLLPSGKPDRAALRSPRPGRPAARPDQERR